MITKTNQSTANLSGPIPSQCHTPHGAAGGFTAGEARIRNAYSKRTDRSLYSYFESAQMLAVQERERKLLSLLARNGYRSFEKTKILEVGCGTGAWLREFIKWGARPENILGIDLLSERISEARMLCPAAVRLKCNSAAQLGEPNATFDLVLQSTVFTSILDAELKRQIASEMLRVLNLEGAIIWYDFRFDNPKNPDVHGIEKNEIADLFPECRIVLHRLTLAPPIGRPMGNLSPALYRVLSCIKPLCTHYLGIITRK